MSNTSKKIVSIIGIVIGVIIIIIGFSLQDTSNYSIGESIKFGADFYTEMYDVTKDVGRAINYAINDLICAISWLIISLGAIDICFFVYKLVKASKVSAIEVKAKVQAEENSKYEVEESNNLNDNPNVPLEDSNAEKSINHIKDDNFIYVQCKNCRKEFSFQKGMRKVCCPWCNAKQN